MYKLCDTTFFVKVARADELALWNANWIDPKFETNSKRSTNLVVSGESVFTGSFEVMLGAFRAASIFSLRSGCAFPASSSISSRVACCTDLVSSRANHFDAKALTFSPSTNLGLLPGPVVFQPLALSKGQTSVLKIESSLSDLGRGSAGLDPAIARTLALSTSKPTEDVILVSLAFDPCAYDVASARTLFSQTLLSKNFRRQFSFTVSCCSTVAFLVGSSVLFASIFAASSSTHSARVSKTIDHIIRLI
jgi:hypothetical protein